MKDAVDILEGDEGRKLEGGRWMKVRLRRLVYDAEGGRWMKEVG